MKRTPVELSTNCNNLVQSEIERYSNSERSTLATDDHCTSAADGNCHSYQHPSMDEAHGRFLFLLVVMFLGTVSGQ